MRLSSSSGDHRAAVDHDRRAGDALGARAGEEEDGGGELPGMPDAAEEDAVREHPLQVARTVLGGHLRGEEARADCIDPDSAPRPPLLGQVSGQAENRCLAGRVGGLGEAAQLSGRGRWRR